MKKNAWSNFRLLVAGKFVSDVGTYLDLVVFPVYAFHLTQSGMLTGLFMAFRFLGGFLSGFMSGVLADRFDRKKLMIVADLMRGMVLLLLAFGPESAQLVTLYLVAFTVGSFNALFDVSLQSSIPVILGQELRVKANSILGSSQSLAMVIGCLSGGLLVGQFGFRTAFLVDGATYILSLLNLSFLNLTTSESKRVGSTARISFWKEAGGAYLYVKTVPIVLAMMAVRFLDCFGSAAHNIAIPLLSSKLNPLKPAFLVGFIYALWAVGKFASAYCMTQMQKRLNLKASQFEILFSVATVTMSASFIFLFLVESQALLGLIAILAGFADGVTDICYSSRLQQTPDEIRGRVFGVSSTLLPIGFGVGTLIASPLLDFLAPPTVVSILHGLPIICALLSVVYFGQKKAILRLS